MSRKIPNQPHPTPDPEKAHGGSQVERAGHPLLGPGHGPSGDPGTSDDEPTYDSVLDDLNRVLSESMESPEPDPNLEPSGTRPQSGPDPEIGVRIDRPGKPPRTSEIFRSVVGPPGPPGTSAVATTPGRADDGRVELAVRPEAEPLAIDRSAAGPPDGDRPGDTAIPWGQIALLAYASALTLALIWLIGTGRIIPRSAPSETPPIVDGGPAPEPIRQAADPIDPAPSPPIPPENLTRLGRSLRIGEIEATPLEIEAGPVELIHAIGRGANRREADCLILRLRLANRSTDRAFSPLDRDLVRDRDLRRFDPYIAAGGQKIRLFPLATESEWKIRGQDFPELRPGESAETLVVAEPGSAEQMAGEMTWRIRLRTGIYRSDMIGVEFNQDQVRRRRTPPTIDEE